MEAKCNKRKPSASQYKETCRWKWRAKSRDYSNAEICKENINHELILSFQQKGHNYWITWADQERLQISELHFDQFPHTFNVFMLEDKIQNISKCLFRFSLANVMDHKSGRSIQWTFF